MELCNVRIEKIGGCLWRVDAPLQQECCKRFFNRELRCKPPCSRIVRELLANPPFIHIIVFLRNRKNI